MDADLRGYPPICEQCCIMYEPHRLIYLSGWTSCQTWSLAWFSGETTYDKFHCLTICGLQHGNSNFKWINFPNGFQDLQLDVLIMETCPEKTRN